MCGKLYCENSEAIQRKDHTHAIVGTRRTSPRMQSPTLRPTACCPAAPRSAWDSRRRTRFPMHYASDHAISGVELYIKGDMRNRSRKHRLTQREPCAVFVPQPSQSTVFFRLNSSHTNYWDNQRHPEIRFPFLPNISRRETSDITLAPSKICDPSYARTHAFDNAGTAKLGATTKILHQT